MAKALAEDSTAEPEVLAYHYVRAGALDAAVRHLEQAGDHAASQGRTTSYTHDPPLPALPRR